METWLIICSACSKLREWLKPCPYCVAQAQKQEFDRQQREFDEQLAIAEVRFLERMWKKSP
jgi:hypothetical protein